MKATYAIELLDCNIILTTDTSFEPMYTWRNAFEVPSECLRLVGDALNLDLVTSEEKLHVYQSDPDKVECYRLFALIRNPEGVLDIQMHWDDSEENYHTMTYSGKFLIHWA